MIKLWNYVDGRLVDSIDCLPFLSDVKSLDADAHSLQTADSASAEKTLTNVEVRCLVAEGASVAVAFDW